MFWLPEEEVSTGEQKIRDKINFTFRLLLASFFSCQIFDFFFNPIWMHGYIWSLNQKIELELNKKSAGSIFLHQLSVSGYEERVLYSIIIVFIIWAFLSCSRIKKRNCSVWFLLRFSIIIGLTIAIVRCIQMKQRLYSAIHEGFYAYLLTFIIGFIITWRYDGKISKTEKIN
ncbi:unnamed protein product [Dracunculus medinensis]|uniref:Exosortase/archaeosortase family protein n=1 Tax=Dracunculus medinensis TaxID=318479 RepID=A0A0N4UKH5_DRAME|nr:unnamed protein product [Dracunculus medinensis]